ncbi:MAG: 5'-3' exonuclease H3TH domain-containing protein [Thermoleophilaceae bacterium]
MAGPLLVVDAPSLLFRAFHALPKSITDGDGQAVNALLGATNMIMREIELHSPRAVVLCFGPDAAEYRVELFPAYHADRPPVPDELAPQFAAADEFFGAFGWYVIASEDLEADDVLGALARVEAESGGEALILTGDRDMFQCVGESVKVLYVRTGSQGAEVVDSAGVRKRYGIPPELVPDFIALRGDPSDGIPGAPGIGEKTAADLLRRHGSLEATLGAAARERPARVSGALLDGRDQLPVFKRMATLQPIELDRPADRDTDWAGAARAARARGMERLAARLDKLAA